MSTHTDGAASPSVGSDRATDIGGAMGTDGAGEERADGAASEPDPSRPRPRGPAPPPRDDVPSDTVDAGPSRRGGNGSARPEAESDWVKEEIRRRIAERGVSETGRHSRSDRARTAPGDPATHGSAPPAPGPRPTDAPVTPRRPRSTRMPDPYAPDGMRDPGENGFMPEQPFRMPGPAAAAPEPDEPASTERDGATGTPPRQWPPADGAAGLPRRVPGAGWTLDRRLLGDGASVPGPAANGSAQGAEPTSPATSSMPSSDDVDPETRMVPALWTAARTDPGPPTADLSPGLVEDVEDDIDDIDDIHDEDGPTGLTGDTEVIWRAPGLDATPAPAPTPLPSLPVDEPAPYTGARPRRFAGATTDAPADLPPEAPAAVATTGAGPETAGREPCPALDDAPAKGRKRIVLSERRAVAHSVRAVVDVQDPGPVGTMFRSRLVSTQLNVALRVGGVALIGLALLPALFAAFPSIGEIAVVGVPLPWILLGFLVYPFLLGLGWWYVRSTERVEQDFVQEVQDR